MAAGFGGTVCCDRLRCTKCDLDVLSFNHAQWAASATYLFFRNGYGPLPALSPVWSL